MDSNFVKEHNKYKKEVDKQLEELITNSPKDMQKYLKSALFPGRRNRPVLLKTLSTLNFDANKTNLKYLSLAIELTHRSSIILDDLIDGDVIRRKTPTFHTMYGTNNTLLISHYLISQVNKAILNISDEHFKNIYTAMTESYEKVVFGELGDIGSLNSQTYLELYKNKILYKTSSLYELVFYGASILRYMNNEQKQLFKLIGNKIGEIYQIYNDIYDDLDSDLYERGEKNIFKINFSLMNCIALDFGTNKDKEFINDIIKNGCTKEGIIYLKEILNSKRYLNIANQYADKTMDELTNLINQIDNESLKDTTKSFAEWVRKKKCWDQNVFKEAGY